MANVCLGGGSPDDHKLLEIGGDIIDKEKGNRSSDYSATIAHGDVSAVMAQAKGFAAFVGDRPEQVSSIVSVSAIDDASMWVKDPATPAERDSGQRNEGTKIEGKIWRRGKTIHLPAASTVETCFARRSHTEDLECLHGCTVHSGSTVLCQANTSTIRSR